jgi:catechol 2,3-dioxygenase-like lactoylglutathione lyase family enzyme
MVGGHEETVVVAGAECIVDLDKTGTMQQLAMLSMVVPDYDEAITWFVGVLGFEVTVDDDLGGGKRWVVVAPPASSGGGASLLLAQASTDEQTSVIGRQGGGRVWLFLHTDDFARDHARMSAAGVRFAETPRHEPYGTVAVFEDCFGNRWDLLQLTRSAAR